MMPIPPKPDVRYSPTYCALLDKYVWAIRTKQADGTWRIVNCLDKDEGCFSLHCAFTAEHGEWPFRVNAQMQPERMNGPTDRRTKRTDG